MAFWWFLLSLPLIAAVPETISLKSSSNLPTPLYNHISSSYNNKLHVLGGYTSNNEANDYVYTTDTLFAGFNETAISHDFWQHPIQCEYRCYVTIDENIYIFLTDDGLNLIIYNMLSQSFQPNVSNITTRLLTQSVNEWWADDVIWHDLDGMIGGCIASDGQNIHLIAALHEDIVTGFYYDHSNDEWIFGLYGTFSAKRAMGCNTANDYVYLFGGELTQSGFETNYIEKCTNGASFSAYDFNCQILVEIMDYKRSYFQVQSVGDYWIIYGGTTSDAQQHIEIFDVEKEKMFATIYCPDIALEKFTSIPTDDYLVLIGGRDDNDTVSDDVQYVETGALFLNKYIVPTFSCVTEYNAIGTNMTTDGYLMNNEGMVFDVMEPMNGSFGVYVDSIDDVAIDYIFERIDNSSLEYTVDVSEWLPASDFGSVTLTVDMETISALTTLNMMYKQSAFWMKWASETDQYGDPTTFPYWKMGFGHVIDEYDLLKLDDNAAEVESQISRSLFLGINKLKLTNGKFSFYTNTCHLELVSFVDSFNVGDYLMINWTLSDATSLTGAIFIKSDDITNINHSMHITGGNCRFCKDGTCTLCEDGIQITDLRTYDVEDNNYKVYLISDVDDFAVFPHNPLVLTRSVMEIDIVFDFDDFMNDTNASNDIYLYPGSELYITPIINKEQNVAQQNGSITVLFDPDIGFNGDRVEIWLDFYRDDCMISYNDQIIDCSEPIVIPFEMKLKSVDENVNGYSVSLQSNNIKLIGTTSFMIQRAIQTVSITLPESVWLGQMIQVEPFVLDPIVYQLSSEIGVISGPYSISSVIQIEYDTNITAFIDQCKVKTLISGDIVGCDQGIMFQAPDGSDAISKYINLTLYSENTLLQDSQHTVRVLVNHCPLGQHVVGGKCEDCGIGSVGIFLNSQCLQCDDTEGVECLGSSHLMISYNYWISVTDDIVSTFCPSGVCCQIENGCNYTNGEQLCALHRNSSVPLCGSCNEGYSEVFGSKICKQCESNNYSYLLYPFGISIFIVLVIVFFDSNTTKTVDTNQKEINDPTPWYLARDDLQALQICFLRPFTYFFQSISYITVQTGFWFYLTPLVSLFSFDFLSESTNESGVCFLKKLKSLEEELWYLFVPISMFMSLGIIAIFNLLTKKICKKGIQRLQFGWNVVWSITLIFVGNIISAMLKVVACSRVGDQLVHFYGGYMDCMGGLWFFAVFTLIGIILFWIVVWFLLQRMSQQQRDSRSSYLRTITKPYKLNFWFWEIILISRRVLLAFLVTFQFINYDVIRYVTVLLLMGYLCLEIRFNPFKHSRANTMDSLCMSMLIVALITVIFDFHRTYPDVVSVIMTVVIVSPILLFIIYVLYSLSNLCRDRNEVIKERVANMKLRLTASQKSLFNEHLVIGSNGGTEKKTGDEDDDDDDNSYSDDVKVATQYVNWKVQAKTQRKESQETNKSVDEGEEENASSQKAREKTEIEMEPKLLTDKNQEDSHSRSIEEEND